MRAWRRRIEAQRLTTANRTVIADAKNHPLVSVSREPRANWQVASTTLNALVTLDRPIEPR